LFANLEPAGIVIAGRRRAGKCGWPPNSRTDSQVQEKMEAKGSGRHLLKFFSMKMLINL
jgi:hypothetical protein